MIVFYSLTLIDLGVRMAIMVSLNFKPIFSIEPLTLSVVALMLALCVGTSHSFILTTLIIDLKTLQCRSQEDFDRVTRLRRTYRNLLIWWSIIIFGFTVSFAFYPFYAYIMAAICVLFICQSTGLHVINCTIDKTLNVFFN